MNRGLLLTVALLAALAIPGAPGAVAQSVDKLRNSDQPLEINAEQGIEWNRNDKTYIARGNARAASGDVEVRADTLTAYYREPPAGQQGSTEIYLLEATGNVRITSPEGNVFGDKGQYKLDQQVFVMTGKNLRLVSKNDVVTARDSLEYWEGQRKAVARGKAHATHEDKQITADVLTAHFQQNAKGDLEMHRVDADGNVLIVTPKERATGEKGVYLVDKQLATLEGDVKITQGENKLDGDRAEVNMATGISKLLGDAGRPVKAVVLPRATKAEMPKPGASKDAAPAAAEPAPAAKGSGS